MAVAATPGQQCCTWPTARPRLQQGGFPGKTGQAYSAAPQTTAQLPFEPHDCPAGQQTPLQQLVAQQLPLQYVAGATQQMPLVQMPLQHWPAQQRLKGAQQAAPQVTFGKSQHWPFWQLPLGQQTSPQRLALGAQHWPLGWHVSFG